MSADAIEVASEPVEEPEAPQAEPEQRSAELVPTTGVGAYVAEPERPTAGVNELVVMKQQALLLAESDIIPAAYQGKPANVLVAAMTGRNYGWDVLTAMRNGHVIEGVWTLRPEAMLALVRRAGHRVEGESSSTQARVVGTRTDDGTTIAVTWTMDDAKRAGLADKKNWKAWPAAMLWARAVAQLCRQLFSDVLLGVSYTPEELGADVNEQGEVIDVSEAAPGLAMPDEWRNPERQRAEQRQADQNEPADGAELWALQLQIQALPDEQLAELRKQWKGNSELATHRPHVLPTRLMRRVRSMVNAHWAAAVAAGANKDMAINFVQAQLAARLMRAMWLFGVSDAERPQDAPEPDGGTEPAAEPQEPQEDEPGPAGDDATATDGQPEPEPTDWRPVLRALATEVQHLVADVPEPVVSDAVDRIKAMHHTLVNRWIAAAGQEASYPPDSPIDLRRMAVSAIWLEHHRDHGELPQEDPA